MNSKTYFIEKLIEIHGTDAPRLLEMSCGTARYMPYILDRYPKLTYVGVEPYKPSFSQAVENIGSYQNVTLHNQLGYSEIQGAEQGTFDIVLSLSALEHIKNLKRYLAMTASYLKPGGLMVHRYDLGHALYPVSLKEQFHAFLGNRFPDLLPEDKFVRYVPEDEVVAHYEDAGCEVFDFSYHQMPNHRALEKATKGNSAFEPALHELYEWEWSNRALIRSLPTTHREKLFPAVTVWGRKR